MERYEELDLIGKGSYGYVHKCRDLKEDGRIVAVKWIRVHREDIADIGVPPAILREISILKELDHENVVRLLDVADKEDGFYLVFEHLDLDLLKFIIDRSKTKVDPHWTKDFLFQTLQGVSYCHSQKVMHRDLKPHNLLIDLKDRRVKLADFGFARSFEVPLPKYTKDVTTVSYRAPEILLEVPYSVAVDIWAVGCIFAEMVTTHTFFSGPDSGDIMIRICRMHGVDATNEEEARAALLKISETAKLPSETSQNLAARVPKLDPEGLDLLSKMLCVNPDRRITALDALNHPYFKDLQVNRQSIPL